jgi:hypothetical protein
LRKQYLACHLVINLSQKIQLVLNIWCHCLKQFWLDTVWLSHRCGKKQIVSHGYRNRCLHNCIHQLSMPKRWVSTLALSAEKDCVWGESGSPYVSPGDKAIHGARVKTTCSPLKSSLAAGWPDEFEKRIAQNVAQHIFCQNQCLTFTLKNST